MSNSHGFINNLKPLPHAVALAEDEAGNIVRAIGRTTLAELRYDFAVNRPSVVETDRSDQCHEVRGIVQRRFVGDRNRNRDDYAQYIQELENSRPGATPPVTLFCPEPLTMDSDGHLYMQRGACLIAIDGETQLDARWMAAELDERIWNVPIPFILHAGIPDSHVRVIVHDLNALGRAIKEAEVVSLNESSPVVRLISDGVEAAGHTIAEINRSGEGMGSKNNQFVTTFGRLVALVSGVHFGPDRIGSRVESFLHTYRHPDSGGSLDKDRMRDSVAAYCMLPREQRAALGKTESKVLGALIAKTGPWILQSGNIDKLLANRKLKRGRMSVSAKFDLLTRGIK